MHDHNALWALTFDMSGDRETAQLALGRPLDGGVRRLDAEASSICNPVDGNAIHCVDGDAGEPWNAKERVSVVGCFLNSRTTAVRNICSSDCTDLLGASEN